MRTGTGQEEPCGRIIAGTGDKERTFAVLQSALERSSVIKGWMEDWETIPTSLQKSGALYFPECDPDVVQMTVNYLESPAEGMIAILTTCGQSMDVLFYVKLYKFALCLGINELCMVSLQRIKDLTRDTEAFIKVLTVSTEEKTNLIEDRAFHDWIMSYVVEKSKILKESARFKSAIMQNSDLAWRVCSLLISSLHEARKVYVPIPPSFITTPDRTPSTQYTPEMERRKSPYSYPPQPRTPSPRRDMNGIKKNQNQRNGTRKFSATVEDAIDQHYLSPESGTGR